LIRKVDLRLNLPNGRYLDFLIYKEIENRPLFLDCLLGVLCERRKDLRGMTQFGSGMRWARIFFGELVKDKEAIFVVPNEMKYAEP
jgi:hypothetical protein